MKTRLILAALFTGLMYADSAFAQIENNNILSAMVDGKELKTQPRRIFIGGATYITANSEKPDKSLRMWFVTIKGERFVSPGLYLIVDEGYNTSKSQWEAMQKEGKYLGIAFMKYVEETREPRMEYHVGRSRRENGGAIEVTSSSEQLIEGIFSATLGGTYWKERTSATVFGGGGRMVDKFVNKAVTKAQATTKILTQKETATNAKIKRTIL